MRSKRFEERRASASGLAFAFALGSLGSLGALCGCGDDAGGGPTGGGGGDPAATTGQGGGVPQPTKPGEGPPQFTVGNFRVELPAFDLEPGVEAFPCYVAPLVLEGPSRVVGGGALTVGPGMHHGNVTARPKTGEGFRPCDEEEGLIGGEAGDVLMGGSVLFGSSTQFEGTEWRTFPEGMGFPISEDFEIVLRMHYLNTTGETMQLAPVYEWYTIDEAEVVELLSPFIWRFTNFTIPPLSELTVGADCAFQGPVNVVSMMPHMHALGTRFAATVIGGQYDGKPFLESEGYNPDGLIVGFDPPLDLTDAQGFRFECSWQNTFNKEIVEGVGDNEMCMLFGYSYPYGSAMTANAAGNTCVMIAAPLPSGW